MLAPPSPIAHEVYLQMRLGSRVVEQTTLALFEGVTRPWERHRDKCSTQDCALQNSTYGSWKFVTSREGRDECLKVSKLGHWISLDVCEQRTHAHTHNAVCLESKWFITKAGHMRLWRWGGGSRKIVGGCSLSLDYISVICDEMNNPNFK